MHELCGNTSASAKGIVGTQTIPTNQNQPASQTDNSRDKSPSPSEKDVSDRDSDDDSDADKLPPSIVRQSGYRGKLLFLFLFLFLFFVLSFYYEI